MSARPGTYRILCPHCGNRQVDTAKRIRIIRGYVLFARHGHITMIGCSTCVAGEVKKQLWINLAAGWWCFPWGVFTPFVVVQNIFAILSSGSDQQLEQALRRAGVDPDDVRVDARGFTGEQRRMLDAAYAVLGRAILADGRIDPRELDLACAIIEQLTGHRIGRDEIVDSLLLSDPASVRFDLFDVSYRVALLRMAADVATIDGVLATSEVEYLRRVARALDLEDKVIEGLLREIRGEDRAGSGAGRYDGDLARALECLEVSNPHDILAIKAAYRRMMLRYHPDRAGSGAETQAHYLRMAQEINWAYDYLLRYAGAR